MYLKKNRCPEIIMLLELRQERVKGKHPVLPYISNGEFPVIKCFKDAY